MNLVLINGAWVGMYPICQTFLKGGPICQTFLRAVDFLFRRETLCQFVNMLFERRCVPHTVLCTHQPGPNFDWLDGSLYFLTPAPPLLLHQYQPYFDEQIWGYLYSKIKMGLAGVIFEAHPPNFENLYNF